ncbi:MAG: hypothetical protein E6G44_06450 [Actinobacteria bacterium]|nr:MAG: hypothetical protein E6G44_06450 [Actinomycetota bacterium]
MDGVDAQPVLITSTASKPASAACRSASRTGRRKNGAVEKAIFGRGGRRLALRFLMVEPQF